MMHSGSFFMAERFFLHIRGCFSLVFPRPGGGSPRELVPGEVLGEGPNTHCLPYFFCTFVSMEHTRYPFKERMLGNKDGTVQAVALENLVNEDYIAVVNRLQDDLRHLDMTWQRKEALKKLMEAVFWLENDSEFRSSICPF